MTQVSGRSAPGIGAPSLVAVLLVAVWLGVPAPVAAQDLPPLGWFVDATAVPQLRASGATVIDVRPRSEFERGHLPTAVHASWWDFTRREPKTDRGRLAPVPEIEARLRQLGVRRDGVGTVLVVGQPPDGWGEDGWLVWLLRLLGHRRAAVVDGGHRAVLEAGVAEVADVYTPPPGDFIARPTGRWLADRAAVRASLADPKVVLLDTRTPEEFAGARLHQEARGGHLPGARLLPFATLIDARGVLLPAPQLRARLAALGVTPQTPVIAYCTGGIRSAWLVAALAHRGYGDGRNYPGSIWEWAAAEPGRHPLVIEAE